MKKSPQKAIVAKNPTREVISRLAEKWTLVSIAALCRSGPLRFGELRRRIKGVSQKMLTNTLRKLEADGLVSRTVYDEATPRVEYDLTPLGKDLAVHLMAMKRWVDENMPDGLPARPPKKKKK